MKATPAQEQAVRFMTIASDLRIALDGWPAGAIEAQHDPEFGWSVGIMLKARLSDDGDPESGPHLNVDPTRFLMLVQRREHWDLDVYDYTSETNDEWDPHMTPTTTIRLHELTGIDSMTGLVAKEVVKLVNSLGLRYETN